MNSKEYDACLTHKRNLESVFNAVYDGLISLDNQLQVVDMNEAAQTFFDVSKEEVIGRSCFCDEILAEVRDILETTLREDRPIKNRSIRLIDASGDFRFVMLSTALLFSPADGSRAGVILILHDVSELVRLQERLDDRQVFHRLVGRNKTMRSVFDMIEKIARSDASTLIEGESGVGKGLIAEAIHERSTRRDHSFVKVNCAALSESLLESELFGHVKGSFTGALRDRIGRFELADGGTIFLDEIGEISPAIQVKLLTVLQERVIERVGEAVSRPINVRIISATNQSLRDLIDRGLFREDLYYRLKVVRLEAPPLRNRLDDIPLLIDTFCERNRRETGKMIAGVDDAALRLLLKYRWPGNVRELENVIAQAFVLCGGETITTDCLPEEVARAGTGQMKRERWLEGEDDDLAELDASIKAEEKTRIIEALRRSNGKKGEAAKLLNINRSTLWRQMRNLGLLR